MQLLEYLRLHSGYDRSSLKLSDLDISRDEDHMKNIIFLISSKQYKVRMSDLLTEIYRLSFVDYGILHNITLKYHGNNSSPSLNMFFQEIVDVLYTDKYCNMAKFGYLLTSTASNDVKTELNVVVPNDATPKDTADEVLTIIKKIQPDGLLYILKILYKYWYINK